MQLNDLLQHLEKHLNCIQKSERWAMYRLIMPVVDYANSTMSMPDYFEFNQTSGHGTSQSVDLILSHNGKPAVMIEAKRVDRRVSAEQIDKYLTPGVRGMVTNGIHWILCLDGRNKPIVLFSSLPSRIISPEALDEIISFIRGESLSQSGWSTEISYTDSFVKPQWPSKEVRARRISNAITVTKNTESLTQELQSFKLASRLDRIFLQSLIAQFDLHGGMPSNLRCDARESRVSFFDERISVRSKRVARIELGKQQPDILVLTSLANVTATLQSLARSAPHDKGPHMRRFRLSDESQTEAFGKALADLLMQ